MTDELTWEEAKDNCVDLGGKLFYDLDGTIDQLHVLYKNVGKKNFWVGVYADASRIWRNLEEVIVADSLLAWLEYSE